MTAQGILFDVSARKLARTTDPATSREAANRLDAGRVGSVRRALLTVFVAPWTSEEAAHRAGVDPWQASKRTSDLLRMGLIEDTGSTRLGSSGREQRILRITDAGREALT